MAAPSVEVIAADAQAAVQGMIADARAAASIITAEAQRSAISAIAGVHQAVTGTVADVRKSVAGAIADMRTSVTTAVSDTARKIGADFAAHVNSEIVSMTANFKASHPEVAQVTTDVVGYVDAVGTVATAVKETGTKVTEAAAQLKELPSAVQDIRTAIKGTLTEAGPVGQKLRQMATNATSSLRDLGSTLTKQVQTGFSTVKQHASNAAEGVGRFVTASRNAAKAAGDGIRNLVQLAANYGKAGIQAALAAARTIGMAIAQRVVAVATRIWAAMQMLLNIAMSLNPVGLIIIGIMILIGLIVLAYQRSETFRSIVRGAMRGVKEAFEWVKEAAGAAFGWIRDHLDDLVRFFSGLPDRLATYAHRMWEEFPRAAKDAINSLIDAWNALDLGIHISVPAVMGVGGFRFDVNDIIPDIPRLAEGGLVRSRPGGVLALLGEGREDELVVPLSRVPALGGLTGRPVTVNVYPRPGQSEYEIGRIAARELAWAAKH